MKSRIIAKTGKRIMTVMLSLVMVVGVFAGVKLDVKAAAKYVVGKDSVAGKTLKEGDTIVFPAAVSGKNEMVCHLYDPSGMNQIGGGDFNFNIYTEYMKELEMKSITYNDITYNRYRVVKWSRLQITVGQYLYQVELEATEDEEEETPAEKSNQNMPNQSTPNSHTCNFQWVTTIDSTTGADGLEEYKCVYCGVVQESHSIPASVAAVKDFYGKVKDAPANGTVTYDSGKLYTISDYLLKKMSERSDVAVTVNFEYQNAKYELTFPAGTDFTPVLMDEETMYGYFGVAAKLGLTVAAK